MVCDLCVGNRIKIQIDHVVKRPDNRTHNFTDICRIIYRKVTKWQRRQITDDKLSCFCCIDDYCVFVFCLYFCFNRRNRGHILRNFRTKIRTINHSFVRVWIRTVHCISVKCKRSSGLRRWFDDQTDQIFQKNCPFLNSCIMNTIPIAALPFFSETIFQTISFYRHDLMRAHQIPGRI